MLVKVFFFILLKLMMRFFEIRVVIKILILDSIKMKSKKFLLGDKDNFENFLLMGSCCIYFKLLV